MAPFVLLPTDLIDEMTPAERVEYEAYLLAESAELDVDDEAPDWRTLARTEQLPPDGDWLVWYVRGGRGGGKTWTGANALAELIQTNPPGEWAVIAPTYGDARDTCIESGDSGLLTALGLPRTYAGWNRSMGELRLPSGSVVYADGADDGALRIQGKNLRGAWCDEVGLWKRWELAWDESLRFAVRKAPARIIATGTPKRNMPAIKLVRRLMADAAVAKSLLRTEDNAANLHPATLTDLMVMAGTPLGMQELEGAVLDDAEGGYFLRGDWRDWEFDTDDVLNLGGQRFSLAGCYRFITTDLAASLRTSADFTVAAACAITMSGDLVILDRVKARVAEIDHAKFLEPLRTTWLQPSDVVFVEATMQSSTLAHQLGRDGVPLQPLRPGQRDKLTRALPYIRMVRQHRVWLPRHAEWRDDWVEEHADFPNPQVHDDQVDTGAYAAEVVVTRWLTPESAEVEQARHRPDPDAVDFLSIPL